MTIFKLDIHAVFAFAFVLASPELEWQSISSHSRSHRLVAAYFMGNARLDSTRPYVTFQVLHEIRITNYRLFMCELCRVTQFNATIKFKPTRICSARLVYL